MVVPKWEHCLEYECQLRKKAIRLTVEENFSIQAALWHAFEDQHHRLTHWVQLLTIANAQQTCLNEEVSKLRKEVADLRQAVSQRSRSPRGKGAGNRALLASAQLALPAPPAQKASGGKGKNGKGKKCAKGEKNKGLLRVPRHQLVSLLLTSGLWTKLCKRETRNRKHFHKIIGVLDLFQLPIKKMCRAGLPQSSLLHRLRQGYEAPQRVWVLGGSCSLKGSCLAEQTLKVSFSCSILSRSPRQRQAQLYV